MNKDLKQTSILIPGMHRSGTSALTGTLSLLDIYLGKDLMEGNFSNEKGYFENLRLFKLNENLLSQIDSSWDDPFFDEEKSKNFNELNDLKTTILDEFQHSKIFAIKDPRLIYLFPAYEEVLKELNIDIKIILPYRNPLEVAASLNRRDKMPIEKGMLLWAYNFLLAEKFTRSYQRVFISFDDLLKKPSDTISQISSKISIPLDVKYHENKNSIDTFLEPGLKHHTISNENISNSMPKIILEILSLKEQFNTTDNKNLKFDELRNELFSYKQLFYNQSIINGLEEGSFAKQSLIIKEQELKEKELQLEDTKEKLHVKEEEISKINEILLNKTDEIKILENELKNIYSSKSWKLTTLLSKIFLKLKTICP